MKAVCAAIVLSVLGVTASAAPVFRNPRLIPLPTDNVTRTSTGDFNGDGGPDLLMLFNTRQFAVAISNRDASFDDPVFTNLASGSVPASGDIDGDGKLDLVITDAVASAVAVLLGNGDGTFQAGPSFSVSGGTLNAVALADFNGDRRTDVAIGAGSKVLVYHGDGAAHFSGPATTISFNYTVSSLTATDPKGQGKSDLLVVSGVGLVLANNGDGSFTTVDFAIPGLCAFGDFNRDGHADVAAADTTSNSPTLRVFLGTADGSLAPPATYVVGYLLNSIVTGDVDKDGNPDLLFTASAGNTVSVMRGTPDGTFLPAQLFVTGAGVSEIVTGDFDGDGNLDFMTRGYSASAGSAMSFVHGNGDGTFDAYRAVHTRTSALAPAGGLQVSGGTVEDMNRDGKPDVVVLQRRPDVPNAYEYELGVLLNDGTGKLATPILSGLVKRVLSARDVFFTTGQIDDDGIPDAVVLSYYNNLHTAAVLLGNGTGGFGPASDVILQQQGRPTLGHFNGDAHVDLFVACGTSAYVYPGNGDGSFGQGIASSVRAYIVSTSDFNGDGIFDYVSTGEKSTITQVLAYLNDGTGRFLPIFQETGDAPAVGDFNDDGRTDVLILTFDSTGVRNGMMSRAGNGDGTFAAPVRFAITRPPAGERFPDPLPVAIADVDGDGHLDVAYRSSIYLGTGDGRFRSRSMFITTGEKHVAFGDMDGNGSPDLIVTKTAADNIDVLLTRTGADPTAPSSITLMTPVSAFEHDQRGVFIANVTSGQARLTGVVRFEIDGVPVALVEPDLTGTAKCTVAFDTGSHLVTAVYTGDEHYQSSTSAPVPVEVRKARVKLQISSGENPAIQPTYFRVQVGSGTYNATPPTGTFTVREGTSELMTMPVVRGSAYKSLTLPIGIHILTVDYSGDRNYEPATATYSQEFAKGIPFLSVRTTPNAGFIADTPFTVRASFWQTPLTGTVAFIVDDVVVATLPLVDGSTELQLSLSAGDHKLRVKYSGDANWSTAQWSNTLRVSLLRGSAPVVVATGGNGFATIRWSPVLNASTHVIWLKKSFNSGWERVSEHSAFFLETTVPMPANTSWLFAATATDSNGTQSPMSAPDLASTPVFTDAITTRKIVIKALHLTDLRIAINGVRALAGLAAFSYTNPIVSGGTIRATDITEMRVALSDARTAIGLPLLPFTGSVLNPGTSLVRATDVKELRERLN